MSNVAKLKKQAAELELKKQFDKALAIYIKLLETFDANASELDVALFNRVGDLLLRQGNVADAVDYYEQAIDRYAETGFFNNAIALCNKVLRHSPGRASVYYKLGKISAQKGFKGDAKVNFLEYADRMQKAGKVDEAFRALKEFADLCPDQDEIRLTLAEQLTKADRKGEAIEQLQTLHERYDAEGRVSEAAATANRMRAIDPGVEPRSSGGGRRKTTSGDLIFIDLDTPAPLSGGLRAVTPPPVAQVSLTPPRPASIQTPSAAVEDLGLATTEEPDGEPLVEPEVEPVVAVIMVPSTPAGPQSFVEGPAFVDATTDSGSLIDDPLPDVTRIGDDSLGIEKSTPSASVLGLEPTRLVDDDSTPATTPPSSALLDLEPTALTEESAPLSEEASPVDHAPAPALTPAYTPAQTPVYSHLDRPATPDDSLDAVTSDAASAATPAISCESIDFDLSELTPVAEAAEPRAMMRPTPGTSRMALEGLPLMDLDLPATPVSTPRVPAEDALSLSGELELLDGSFTPQDLVEVSAPEDDDSLADGSLADDSLADDSLADDSLADDSLADENIELPTPSKSRRSTLVAVQSVELLKTSVDDTPDDWGLRRDLAEAMLEAGDRSGGLRELELAMSGAERSGDLDLASAIAEEVARLEPDLVRHHQKRVEYAFRTNDRGRLVEAYVSLADALLRSEQVDKARTVYERVLDLAPNDVRAKAALDSLPPEVTELPPTAVPPRKSYRPSAATPAASTAADAAGEGGAFVNLGDWIRDTEAPKDTRMVVEEEEPTGDEEADFADMLRKFKQGVAENVGAEDYQSHYDLAIAFKEMGLLDEAVAEFQKALGGASIRLPTYEALGQCFLDKGQPKLATSILSRALNEKASEDQLIGVLYLLGRAAEEQGNASDAVTFYQRVFVIDIRFRDIADRLPDLERATR